MDSPPAPHLLLARLYKSESARLLAVLVRLFGPKNLDLAEDVLQEAFQRALLAWQEHGVPDNPTGWIMRAARNQAIDTLRKRRTRERHSDELRYQLENDWTLGYAVEREFSEPRVRDDQLRMIFMCASAGITPENRVPLMLRSLCGFSVEAIARALLLSEETVKKRLLRAREKLRGHNFELPPVDQLPPAMDSVHTVIYLLFNEGFHSPDDVPLRRELCLEAMHLCSLLIEEPRLVNRDTLGLNALMRFQLARAASRVDEHGDNVPIDLQDRAQWDRAEIETGQKLLEAARFWPVGASGRFFWEAAIAYEHCRCRDFASTDWATIAEHYEQLVASTRSPIALLNQAVALAYAGAIERAVSVLDEAGAHPLLEKSHLPPAVRAHLHAMQGHAELAREYAARSAELGGSTRELEVMHRQIERLLQAAPPHVNGTEGRS